MTGRWDKSGVDHARQAEIAAEARRRGISEATLEAAKAVPDDVVRALVADFRRGVSPPSSIVKTDRVEIERRRVTSTSTPVPLVTPYVAECDRLMDQQDALDLAKRAKELRELKDDPDNAA